MSPIARIERLANRSSFLLERQGNVFHRFLARIQCISKETDLVRIDALVDELEAAVKSEEALAAERRAA